MKTFTKIVLAAGIIGAIGKFVNDHLVISVKKKEPEELKEKKMEPIDIPDSIKRMMESNMFYNCYSLTKINIPEPEEKKQDPKNEIIYDEALDGLTDFDDPTEPDHIYYDNPYNVCKIYKDENGCPWYFEFEHPIDAECALYQIASDLLDTPDGKGVRFSLANIFVFWGLVIDDYKEFADWFVCWERDEFLNANYENADPKIVSFGEFESPKEELK